MPRSPKPRTIDDHTSSRDDDARHGWVGGWKAQAVGQLPADVPVRVKVQLRKDVERALAHYRLDDDEAEIRDVVAAVVQEALQRFASELAAQVQKVAKERDPLGPDLPRRRP